MFKFNVKNLKYSTGVPGAWDAPVDLAYAHAISLEADYNETKLYGDGEKLAVLADDKGKTGSISVTNIEEAYEIACGRMLAILGGTADIQQRATVEHCIYYEVEAIDDGTTITIKNWLFGCITGKANESYQQTEDDPTFNKYEYPLTVLGINLQIHDGGADFVDANGNTIKVFRLTSYPDTTGYATFGDAVPLVESLT